MVSPGHWTGGPGTPPFFLCSLGWTDSQPGLCTCYLQSSVPFANIHCWRGHTTQPFYSFRSDMAWYSILHSWFLAVISNVYLTIIMDYAQSVNAYLHIWFFPPKLHQICKILKRLNDAWHNYVILYLEALGNHNKRAHGWWWNRLREKPKLWREW